jgi:hypothetical protein
MYLAEREGPDPVPSLRMTYVLAGRSRFPEDVSRGAPNALTHARRSGTISAVGVQRGGDGTRDTIGRYLAGVVQKVRTDLGGGRRGLLG